MNRLYALVGLLVLLLSAAAGCGEPPPASDGGNTSAGAASEQVAAPVGDATLRITGKVSKEVEWTEAELRSMPMVDAQVADGWGGPLVTRAGVPIGALLEEAGVASDATKMVFVSANGSTTQVALGVIEECPTCCISFLPEGGLRSALPDMAMVEIKGLAEMRVE